MAFFQSQGTQGQNRAIEETMESSDHSTQLRKEANPDKESVDQLERGNSVLKAMD